MRDSFMHWSPMLTDHDVTTGLQSKSTYSTCFRIVYYEVLQNLWFLGRYGLKAIAWSNSSIFFCSFSQEVQRSTSVGKTRKTATAKKNAARKKGKRKKKCGWAWPWETHCTRPRDPPPLTTASNPCCRQATRVGGSGDLGSHTSPQSSWSE